jgi:hypothetical protein
MQIMEQRRNILPPMRPVTMAFGDEIKKTENKIIELTVILSAVGKSLAQKDLTAATEIFPLVKLIRALQDEME